MYLHVGVFAKAQYLAFCSSPFGAKRWMYTVVFTAAFLLMWLLQQYYCIDYRRLATDPAEVVESVCRHFGWSISEPFRARLGEARQRQRTFKSRHRYSLEQFGLSKEWVQQHLGPLLDFYELTP